MAEKIDLFKLHKDEYAAPKTPTIVDVGEAKYLSVVGRGAPGSDMFAAKIGALYGAAYTIKMTRKFSGEQDYVVCKLEGQYWLDDDGGSFEDTAKDDWNWKLMIRTPDFVTQNELERGVKALLAKGKDPEVKTVVLESINEGTCVQMLHVGPYECEHETIAAMRAFATANGFEYHGLHHEVYVSDPRRVPPERLKTILRHPVQEKS